SFCAGPVQITASNTSDHYYVGVGTPFAASRWHLIKHSVFSLFYLHSLAFALMALPIVVLSWVARKLRVAGTHAWLVGTVAFGLLAYATFFILQANKSVAIAISFGFYAACVVAGGWALARRGVADTSGLVTGRWRIP